MTRPARSAALAVAALLGGLAGGSAAAAEPGVAEPVVVTYTSTAALDQAVADGGVLDRADGEAEPIAALVAGAELTDAEQAAVAEAPGVVAVEPDSAVYAAEVPDDPCYQQPGSCGDAGLGVWHVDRIGLPAAWDVSHGSNVVVAVIDTGVGAIAELQGKLLPEINASGGPACLTGSRLDHGTEVASLIAAITDNGLGIPGVGWDAQILPVRVWAGQGATLACNESTSLSSVLTGITAARDGGARIINISLTTASAATALRTTIVDVIASGAVVVAAAGNSGSSDPSFASGGYPAAFPEVVSVGATCPADPVPVVGCDAVVDSPAQFSNFGPTVDVFAPGVALPSFRKDGVVVAVHGTSFSSPVVAGVVALLRAARPGLTPAQIQDVLVRTADPVPGLLRVDAGGALYDAVFGADPPVGAGAVSQPGGVAEVVARANDGRPWSRTIGGATTRWSVLDGSIKGDPDVVGLADGSLAMIARGLDDGAYYRTRVGGTWSPWAALGGTFTSDLSVATASGRVDFFGRGLDGAMWHSAFVGSAFTGWEHLGGGFTSEPDATAWFAGRLDVFARGLDGALWHRAFQGSWMPWESLGGGFLSGPGAAAVTPSTLHIAAVGLDRQVWLKAWTESGYTDWAPLGGILVSSPELSTSGPPNLDVYARAGDQQLWRLAFVGWASSGWLPVS